MDEIVAAAPEIDEYVARLVSQGRWMPPGYHVSDAAFFLMFSEMRMLDGCSLFNRRNSRITLPCRQSIPSYPPSHYVHKSLALYQLSKHEDLRLPIHCVPLPTRPPASCPSHPNLPGTQTQSITVLSFGHDGYLLRPQSACFRIAFRPQSRLLRPDTRSSSRQQKPSRFPSTIPRYNKTPSISTRVNSSRLSCPENQASIAAKTHAEK